MEGRKKEEMQHWRKLVDSQIIKILSFFSAFCCFLSFLHSLSFFPIRKKFRSFPWHHYPSRTNGIKLRRSIKSSSCHLFSFFPLLSVSLLPFCFLVLLLRLLLYFLYLRARTSWIRSRRSIKSSAHQTKNSSRNWESKKHPSSNHHHALILARKRKGPKSEAALAFPRKDMDGKTATSRKNEF